MFKYLIKIMHMLRVLEAVVSFGTIILVWFWVCVCMWWCFWQGSSSRHLSEQMPPGRVNTVRKECSFQDTLQYKGNEKTNI